MQRSRLLMMYVPITSCHDCFFLKPRSADVVDFDPNSHMLFESLLMQQHTKYCRYNYHLQIESSSFSNLNQLLYFVQVFSILT